MAAANTDLIRQGASGISTTLSGSISNSDTSFTPASISNIPTITAVDLTIDRVDSSGTLTPSKMERMIGVVSGGNIVSILRAQDGTSAQSHSTGAVVEMIPTGKWSQDLATALLTSLDQDGTLKAGAVDNAAVVASGILTADRNTAGANIETWRSEDVFDHIASGCVWSGDAYGSTRNASCTSGVVYIAGKRLTVAAVTARSFTASKDVYCDLKDNGDGTAVWVYYDNTTNAASPSFATTGGTVRGAIIVVGASSIAAATSVNQGQEDRVLPIASSVPYQVTDSLGNLICPREPARKLLGQRRLTSGISGITTAATLAMGTPFIADGVGKVVASIVMNAVQRVAFGNMSAAIWDGAVGSTQLQRNTFAQNIVNGAVNLGCDSGAITPSAGLHTYNVSLETSANNCDLIASATAPCVLRIMRA